ncbi:hypothetical protein MKW92_024886, partial [Papaver armeniacum]
MEVDAVKDYFPLSSKFKWQIDKVSELNHDNRFSPVFKIGHCKWYINLPKNPNHFCVTYILCFHGLISYCGRQLLAFRRKSNADDYLSVYVVAVGWTDSRYAKFSISVVGEANNTFKKDTEGHVLHFTKEETDWGFDEFIRFNELTDPSNGYMFNDAFTVEVELCSFSKQDFIEELEPMELIEIESDHSDVEFTHEKTKKRKELEEDNSSSVQ